MKKYLKLLLLVLWMSVIFYLSSQSDVQSADTSNLVTDIIYKILNYFSIDINYGEAAFIETFSSFVRKLAHFSEFLILGVLTVSNLFEIKRDRKYIYYAIIFCVLYAISDEVHQLFVINRYCSILDMLLDSLGAITGIFIYHLSRR